VIGLPQPYKLAGAAIATALSQTVGGGIPLLYFFRKNDSLLHLGRTRFEGKALWKACTNGSSEFMSNVSMNVVGMLYNLQLLRYAGEDGVAAYGVMMYVSLIFAAVFIGYSIGTAPVVGFHFGAQNHPELRSLRQKSLWLTGLFGILMILAAEVLAVPLSRLFVGYDEGLMDLTVSGFRIFGLSFLPMGYAIFCSGFFTALNDGLTSALVSFLRTMVFQIAAVLILPALWGIDGIWWSILVAETMAVVLSALFLIAKRRRYRY
jgi:Na+-driven multidrug efflux pump